jgi:hypothetical protein
MTYPDTPATFSNFRMSVGGRTISFSIADSIVIGCPSSSISSTSYLISFFICVGASAEGLPYIRYRNYPSMPSRSHPLSNPVKSPEMTRGMKTQTGD